MSKADYNAKNDLYEELTNIDKGVALSVLTLFMDEDFKERFSEYEEMFYNQDLISKPEFLSLEKEILVKIADAYNEGFADPGSFTGVDEL